MSREERELNEVELPFCQQLQTMGWDYIAGDTEVPSFTERNHFDETILEGRLRVALAKLNPWATEQHIQQGVHAARHLNGTRLMERNEAGMELLVKGISVDVDPNKHGGVKSQTLRFVDFGPDGKTENDFLAINQFRANILGSRSFCIPDIVLFVNGLPLVVVECKSPVANNPMESAITDLLKYSNQRDSDEPEGVERLFDFNLFLVATFGNRARSGTIAARPKHYMEWKCTSPIPTADFAEQLGVEQLSSQQTLVAGMLHPDRLLDLLRNFALFTDEAGRTIKIIARYQQYRAVHEAILRLRTKPSRIQDGDEDKRGGIVWHTQGSGKSLTMVFLIRKMRTIDGLKSFKIIVLTDRRSLHRQLAETAQLTGEPLTIPKKMAELPSVLKREGKDLIFTLIQRMRSVGPDGEIERDEEAEVNEDALSCSEEDFPEVDVHNNSEKILLLVDEAHRSHGSTTHAMMMSALPNCAKIGFTGTPIMDEHKTITTKIFGTYIGPPYTIKQSQDDGATRPIRYEGWSADSDVSDDKTIDEIFDEAFRDLSDEQREAIKAKYITKSGVRDAEALVKEHAEAILKDYINNVLPNGFKAQVVATSRRGAIRYQAALADALGDIVQNIEDMPQYLREATEEEQEQLTEDQRFLIRASQHLEILQRLESAAVVSGSKVDVSDWTKWTTRTAQDTHVRRFKKPLHDKDPEKQDGLAILCVKSMLLTGFDAPINQTLYVDRFLQGHELLQAIARVNRNYGSKRVGRVVDFYGVAWHLGEALRVYSVDDRDDIKSGLTTIRDDLNMLHERHKKTLQVFAEHKITDIYENKNDCVHLLRSDKIRAKFAEELKGFLSVLNSLRFRPESRQYLADAKQLGYIGKEAANMFRSEDLEIVECGDQVRELIDKYVRSQGINPEIEPVDILHADFKKEVDENYASARSQAAAMEHAAQSHCSKKMDENPVLYQEFSERVRQILEQFADNWEEQKRAFFEWIKELNQAEGETFGGLDPMTQVPFFRTILRSAGKKSKSLTAEETKAFGELTVEILDHAKNEIQAANFWGQPGRPQQLRDWIKNQIDDWAFDHPDVKDVFSDEIMDKLADDLYAQVRAKSSTLT